MSADLDKAQAEGVELSTAATASNQQRYPPPPRRYAHWRWI
jgi:hypothetical protein